MKTQITIFVFLVLVMTRDVSVSATNACSAQCGTPPGTGQCQSDGKCLCWYGWTGPRGAYIQSGSNKGKIKADHCQWACHWTHDTQNPDCVDQDTGDCGGGSDSESDSE